MDKTDTNTPAECCTDLECEAGRRNNYFEGKRLTTDSFRVEQRYLMERRHLVNRALHGWGVVYGYPMSSGSLGRLTIGPGLALDECGRELLQVETLKVTLDDLVVLDEKGARTDLAHASAAAHPVKPPMCWLLSVHYAEQYSGPVTVNDSCRCEHQEWEHTCETVRYSLRRIACTDCCGEAECELTCGCVTGPCCNEPVATYDPKNQPYAQPHATLPFKRGGCCLCEHITRLQPGAENCCALTEIEEPCGHVRVDLRHGVPLACVTLAKDAAGRLTFAQKIDACGPRRLVKRNDLLFDLIRGCDLTRITEIGWAHWHRSEEAVPFDKFSNALGPPGKEQDYYVTNDFWVTFSRPVREDTLRPDCFAMTFMSIEREGGWWQTFRVPIVGIDTTKVPPAADDPANYVRSARLVVDGGWLEDAVRGRKKLFLGYETRIEIEIRGDFIIDCNGQPVDANAVGLSPQPTGNGTPGGTFLSNFRVAAAPEAPVHTASYSTANRLKGASS
jgi:hypothetical protein